MSRRLHTTEVGGIECVELDSLGAGKECWLVENQNILCALDSHFLALSNQTLTLIIPIIRHINPSNSTVKIHPDLLKSHEETITALEWLRFFNFRVLAIGTSYGHFMVYSTEGILIHKQMIHPVRVLKLRVRGMKRDLRQDTAEEVCVIMPGIIARFDGSDIQRMLRKSSEETDSQYWHYKAKNDPKDRDSFERLPFQIWNINKYGTCADAAITGIIPPPLLELESSQRYYCAIAIGADAVISAFRLSENRNRSLIGAILSEVVPLTFSTITTFSKLIWRSEQTSPKKSVVKPQPFARASSLTCFKDHPRKGEKLTLSPSGTLAAVTDSLGRISLIDTQALVVVRLWKGYRDASCLFMEILANEDSNSSSSYTDHVKSDYSLCLAVHAPKKGIIEVWQMRTGPRVLTTQCPKGSKILQPAYRFGSSFESASQYTPLEVFLLNGDSGQISVLNRSLS